MKKFVFALQKILELRESIENNEKNKLAMFYLEQNNALAKQQQLLDRFQQSRSRQQQFYNQPVSASQLLWFPLYHRQLCQQAEALQKEIEQINRQIELQVQIVLKATQEKEILIKLKEKQAAEYQKTVIKENEKFIEEFVSHQLIAYPNQD